jgi:hypothetical protein
VLTGWFPKARLEGDTEIEAEVPVPDRGTVCGLPEELSEMLMEAERLPLAPGVKVTLIAQLPLAATEVPQVLVWAKSEAFAPRIAMLVKLSGPFPELLKVTV